MDKITLYGYLNSVKPFFQKSDLSEKKVIKTHKEVEMKPKKTKGGMVYYVDDKIEGGAVKNIEIWEYNLDF